MELSGAMLRGTGKHIEEEEKTIIQRKQRNIIYRPADSLSLTPLERNPVTAVRMGVSVGLGTSSPYPKELLQCCSLPGALPVPWMCFHTSNPAGILGPPLFSRET